MNISRLYKITLQGKKECHNQAPQPGNIWHNRSESIASWMSCCTCKWNTTIIFSHEIFEHVKLYFIYSPPMACKIIFHLSPQVTPMVKDGNYKFMAITSVMEVPGWYDRMSSRLV